MARPRKSRIVYSMPNSEGFVPMGYSGGCCRDTVIMTVDEYEVIRLIDYLGMSQEECAESMNVSRPTVTNICETARRKLADALVNEKELLIEGGDFDVISDNMKIAELGEEKSRMKIAVTYENGQVFQHFGHCENFKFYTVEDGKITGSEVVNAMGSGHGALAGFLRENGADTLICGGIGGGAKMALAEAGIQLFGGVSGSADAAAEALVSGGLQYNPDATCNHHGEGHTCGNHSEGHGEGHGCGGHGEGHGGCGGHGCH